MGEIEEPMLSECVCTTPGQDDGATTCWLHHNCLDGVCTHIDPDDLDK